MHLGPTPTQKLWPEDKHQRLQPAAYQQQHFAANQHNEMHVSTCQQHYCAH
jgi:hypothetical protein